MNGFLNNHNQNSNFMPVLLKTNLNGYEVKNNNSDKNKTYLEELKSQVIL